MSQNKFSEIFGQLNYKLGQKNDDGSSCEILVDDKVIGRAQIDDTGRIKNFYIFPGENALNVFWAYATNGRIFQENEV